MTNVVDSKTEYIEAKVLIKEAMTGNQDKIFCVKGLPKGMIYGDNGKIHRGIEISQTGDGSFVFFTNEREGKERLKLIDNYIESVYPRTRVAPKRIVNATMPGVSSSGPLTASQLEQKYESAYGVPYVDLPRPEVPFSTGSKTTTEMAIDTFKEDGYQRSDQASQPKPVETATASNLFCAQCDFIAKNKKSLVMHINVKHKKVIQHGPTNTTESNS